MRLASLVLLATAAFGQAYTASTFAGVWLPENLPGASVSLNQIGGVAVDAAGNVFLSLPRFAAVMRLDATTGILTRVAGNATNGFRGDNGPAVNAQLNGPNGLALDPAGNLYIADTNNKRIRKVSNGIITTVAGNGDNGPVGDGGPATSAGSIYLTALAVDAAGNLYISDFYGVRKVTNGVIASVAGAQGYFTGIAVDTEGNLFLVGPSARVLKVSNGVATTFAGNGTYGFSGDGQVSTWPLARQSVPVHVYIGRQISIFNPQLQYAGPAPGEIAGLMQISVPLPLGLKTGSAVPVAIFVGMRDCRAASLTSLSPCGNSGEI